MHKVWERCSERQEDSLSASFGERNVHGLLPLCLSPFPVPEPLCLCFPSPVQSECM